MEKPLLNLYRTLEYVRSEVNITDLSTLTLSMLLLVHNRENISMKSIEEDMQLSQAAVSRNIEKLSIGLGLVDAYENPEYRREKLVRLTPKGRKFMSDVQTVLLKAPKGR